MTTEGRPLYAHTDEATAYVDRRTPSRPPASTTVERHPPESRRGAHGRGVVSALSRGHVPQVGAAIIKPYAIHMVGK